MEIIAILLSLLMVYFAPIPIIAIFAHYLTIKKVKIKLYQLILVTIPLWIILGVITYFNFTKLFIEKLDSFNLKIIGSLVLLIWLVIEYKSRKELGSSRIRGSTQLNKKSDKLIISGVYKYARHPRYLEHPLLFLGLGLLFGYTITLWFSLYLFLVFVITIYFEEKELLERYGKKYENYRKNTPAFFIRLKK